MFPALTPAEIEAHLSRFISLDTSASGVVSVDAVGRALAAEGLADRFSVVEALANTLGGQAANSATARELNLYDYFSLASKLRSK